MYITLIIYHFWVLQNTTTIKLEGIYSPILIYLSIISVSNNLLTADCLNRILFHLTVICKRFSYYF